MIGPTNSQTEKEVVHMNKKRIPDGFEEAVAPAIAWYKEHCDPHQMIIIESGIARLTSDELGIPFEVAD